MNFHLWGGVKSSHSKGLQGFIAEKFSYIGIENLPSTVGRGRKIDLSKAKVRFSGEGLDLSDGCKFDPSPTSATQVNLLASVSSPDGRGKKAAFTLAEVLITLGIIGVVAAMTLPTLISNYQKQVYVNQLKKSVSVLSQGFTTIMGQEGVTRLSDTEVFSGIPGSACNQFSINTDDCRGLKEGLNRVFSGIQFSPCEGPEMKSLNGLDDPMPKYGTCIKFADGLEIYNFSFYKTVNDSGRTADLLIDINGPKNPNTLGRDGFRFILGNNGTVYPDGSQISSEITCGGDPNRCYWRTSTLSSYKCTLNGDGYGCAGRVLEEDAMNY